MYYFGSPKDIDQDPPLGPSHVRFVNGDQILHLFS